MNPDPHRPPMEAWRDIEPGPGFEDAVWRQIEARPVQAPARSPSWLDLLVLRPIFATAAGLVAGILIGLSTTTASAPRADEFALLGGDSLAGSYLHLVKGDSP